MEPQAGQVDPIDADYARLDLNEPKQGGCDRRLSGARAPDDACVLTRCARIREAIERRRQARPIAQAYVVKLYGAVCRPALREVLISLSGR